METQDLKATLGELAGTDRDAIDEQLTLARREGIPSRPLLGRLPLARVIPQDVHSVLDYTGGLALGIGGLLADSRAGRVTGLSIGTAAAATSLMTDYRMSVAKVIPIEVHEALDYVVGFGAVAAPFALGYWKKDPVAALMHVAVGATVILGSLFTDYRARRGISWRGAR
jgi:hypothetical protein